MAQDNSQSSIAPEPTGPINTIKRIYEEYYNKIKDQPLVKLFGVANDAGNLVNEGLRGQLGPEWSIGTVPFTPDDAFTGVATATKQPTKQAIKELTDLLLGRSSRVPQPSVYKPMSDADASIAGLLNSRVGNAPPAPTRIDVRGTAFKNISRILPRDSKVYKAYRDYIKFLGKSPDYVKTVRVGTTADRPVTFAPAPVETAASSVVKQTGSLHDAEPLLKMRVITNKERRNLIEGPKNALDKGIITKQQYDAIMKTNKAKLDAYDYSLQNASNILYNNSLKQKLATKNLATTTNNKLNIDNIKRLMSRGMPIEDISKRYNVPVDALEKLIK